MAQPNTPVAETVSSRPSAPSPKKPVRRNGRRKVRNAIIFILVLALLAAGGVLLYRFLNDGGDAVGEIYYQPATIGTIQSKVSGSGTARAKETAAITLTQSGTVQEVYVTSGQTVMAGQPLYSVFSLAAEEAVSAAHENVSALQEDMAALQEEKNALVVRAPFSGKLTEVKKFTPGLSVPVGSVATLVNDRQLRLSLYFSYAYEDVIHVGQPVEVAIPVVMDSFSGYVETVNKVHYVTPEGGIHFEVIVLFDNPGTLTEGMSASATLTAPDGTPIYPYENTKTEYCEVREITAETSGPLLTQNLLRYANVEKGDILLTMGSDAIDARIRAKQTEIDTAEQRLAEAQAALDNFNAVAPIDGTVISCSLTEGAEVKQGDTVIMISNTTSMLVTINVDDRNISFVKPGGYVELMWNGMPYQGLVTSIDMGGAQAGQGMTNYPVTLSVDNFDNSLMDGAWLQYSFVTSESSDCILVPTTAVKYVSDTEGTRQSVVFVRRDVRPDDVPELDLPAVEQGQKKQFPTEEDGFYPVIVETGISDAQNVEITSGLQVGDEVFVNFTVTDYGSNW